MDPLDNLESMKFLIDTLRNRERELLKDKQEMEVDFGLKRAKFMELFRQKEGKSN